MWRLLLDPDYQRWLGTTAAFGLLSYAGFLTLLTKAHPIKAEELTRHFWRIATRSAALVAMVVVSGVAYVGWECWDDLGTSVNTDWAKFLAKARDAVPPTRDLAERKLHRMPVQPAMEIAGLAEFSIEGLPDFDRARGIVAPLDFDETRIREAIRHGEVVYSEAFSPDHYVVTRVLHTPLDLGAIARRGFVAGLFFLIPFVLSLGLITAFLDTWINRLGWKRA